LILLTLYQQLVDKVVLHLQYLPERMLPVIFRTGIYPTSRLNTICRTHAELIYYKSQGAKGEKNCTHTLNHACKA
jgi:hypothetical protein